MEREYDESVVETAVNRAKKVPREKALQPKTEQAANIRTDKNGWSKSITQHDSNKGTEGPIRNAKDSKKKDCSSSFEEVSKETETDEIDDLHRSEILQRNSRKVQNDGKRKVQNWS